MSEFEGSGESSRVYGVDFSAAATDAGTKTWIASGTVDADGGLLVTDVAPLVEFADLEEASRETSLSALAGWIRGLGDDAAVGLDFPFGLPRFIVEATGNDSWRSVIRGFPESIGVDGDGGANGERGDAEAADPVRAFAERCVELTEVHGDGTYDKRETDRVVGARSPYGFIADTIAFYGMRDVLGAIVDDVRFAPMDLEGRARRSGTPSVPTVVETYPAAILDRRGLHRTNYKGGSDAETTRRRRNVEGLAATDEVRYKRAAPVIETAVDDENGDAADALAACVGAFAARRNDYGTETGDFDDPTAVHLEGYIYS